MQVADLNLHNDASISSQNVADAEVVSQSELLTPSQTLPSRILFPRSSPFHPEERGESLGRPRHYR